MSSDLPPRIHRQGRIAVWIVLLLALVFGCFHAVTVSRYLGRITRETFDAPVDAGNTREVTLGVAADGRTWLRLTEERLERGDWRFGRTQTDGGPEGRDVLWFSPWSWWLEGLGRMRAMWTGEPLLRAIEAASTWAQLPLWIGMICVGGWWMARMCGVGAGALFVATLAGHRGLYVSCYPGYPDHHGAAAAAVLGTVLGLLAVVSGRRSTGGGSGRGVWISALSGATGLAISAASLVPVLLGLGVALACCREVARRVFDDEKMRRVAATWSLWGRVGGVATLTLYALEFFPDRLSWRLEVNHPLYALAWWGGGELLAWWWARACAEKDDRPRLGWAWPVACVIAVVAPFLVILAARESVFTPIDGFIAGVHRHITEFYPLWRMSGSAPKLLILSCLPLFFVPWAWRRSSGERRVALLGLTLLSAGLLALSVWQHRWWSLAGAAQASLAALVGTAFMSPRRGWPSIAVVTLLFAITIPSPMLLLVEQARVARLNDVQAADAMQLLYRDLGLRLASLSTEGKPVVLAAPDTSVGVGYYGGVRTPGTLYWENGDGLRIAARVFAATDDAAAEAELVRAGVTHLLLVEPGDFSVEYADALARSGATPVESEAILGRRLLDGRSVPAWARALPYSVPPQFARMRVRVALYAFVPGLGLAESRRALGVARLVAGDEAVGRAALREAARLGSAEAALVLAWRLATDETLSRVEAEEAVRLASGAVSSLPEAAAHRRVLAACYAAAGRWPEAQAAVLRALDLAQESGDASAVAELERDFARYRDFLPPSGAGAAR